MIQNIVYIAVCVYLFVGIISFVKYNDIYKKLFISSLIDTMALITLLIGLMISKGFSIFSLKLLLILVLTLITVPIGTHIISRCIYFSGERLDE
ncbi:MAG: monovalent cation/H(+) antiporter subunit G [Peptostreptococcaceae bacterium]|jgi:multicomponent Na+:H+ antiporter subunit G|nr:monovalent cation/H(+) antiporter subunit G [Peptostreptococcaceae bacterium]